MKLRDQLRVLATPNIHRSHARARAAYFATFTWPSWAKQAMDEYASAANVVDGTIFRPINKGGRVTGERMTEQAVYNLVTHYAASLGIALGVVQ